MSSCDDAIYKVDTLTVNGVAIEIEDSSATVSGLAGFENEAVVAAGNGKDGIKRKKVPCIIKAKSLLKRLSQVTDLSTTCQATIVLKDGHTQQRIQFSSAAFGKMGDVGNGSADIEFIATSKPVFL